MEIGIAFLFIYPYLLFFSLPVYGCCNLFNAGQNAASQHCEKGVYPIKAISQRPHSLLPWQGAKAICLILLHFIPWYCTLYQAVYFAALPHTVYSTFGTRALFGIYYILFQIKCTQTLIVHLISLAFSGFSPGSSLVHYPTKFNFQQDRKFVLYHHQRIYPT